MRAFVAYGELGQQIDSLLAEVEGHSEACYFDDILYERETEGAHPFETYSAERFRECSFYVCLGYRHLHKKMEVVSTLLKAGRRLPTVCHPSVYLNPSANIGAGTIVYPLTNIDRRVDIGDGVLLNNSVVISHNARIGDGCYLSPGVVLSGAVTVGSCTFIGSGAVVADGVEIGDDVIVGIGTVVTNDVPSGVSVIGNPMRVLTSALRL
jgi:sugar O-acyltransferase (sialic acid O-acetyltransferase NeuD family)